MTQNDRHLWIDLIAARYHAALERQDFDAQAALWTLVAEDTDLEAAFQEVLAGLVEDEQATTVSAVAAAAEQHLTGGTVVRPAAGPMAVADVADELFRHTPDRLPADAHALNDRLRASAEPIPPELGYWPLCEWLEAKFGVLPAGYLDVFQQAALKVRMRSNSEAEYQLAARRTTPQAGGSS